MELTKQELEVILKVKENIKEDRKKGPWSSDKWYKGFTKANSDGVSLKEAPLNEPLMVVTESMGTLYKNDRGNSIMRGSVFIKVSDTEVQCIDSSSWSAFDNTPLIYSNNGFYEFEPQQAYGLVKKVLEVIL